MRQAGGMSKSTHARSPRVTRHRWGQIEVHGCGVFRDAKLFPGGARGWDWNETGMRHRPGVQPADIQELLDGGAEVIVLSRGRQLQLQVPASTLSWLQERSIEVHVLPTEEAVAHYNALIERARVGALIHTTC